MKAWRCQSTRGVSFVSITQQFNTTTSMGQLTLNVHLSFAQFGREVTGERIRDKIAASKKRGMWMGGMPPLGFDVKTARLGSLFQLRPANPAKNRRMTLPLACASRKAAKRRVSGRQ